MTITERIAAAVKPIIDDHNRESRERIGQLERDINEARAHLEVARTTCERLTKQAPQTQQDGPWCVVANGSIIRRGHEKKRFPVVYEGPRSDDWGEDSGHVMLSRRVADETCSRLATEAPEDIEGFRVVTVAEWVAIYTRVNGPVTT